MNLLTSLIGSDSVDPLVGVLDRKKEQMCAVCRSILVGSYGEVVNLTIVSEALKIVASIWL